MADEKFSDFPLAAEITADDFAAGYRDGAPNVNYRYVLNDFLTYDGVPTPRQITGQMVSNSGFVGREMFFLMPSAPNAYGDGLGLSAIASEELRLSGPGGYRGRGFTIDPDTGPVIRISDSQETVTANRTLDVPNESGTLALTVQSGDLEITDSARGVILRSPNGTRYRLTVEDNGDLTTTSL